MPVGAQGEVDDGKVEVVGLTEMDPSEVPDAGSFGDLFLRARERVQLFLAKTDEEKLELEEKFAVIHEAQLEKLESLPDEHPKKEELIGKLEERHEEMIEGIEMRAGKLEGRKEELLGKLDELEARFEVKRELVEANKAEREEMKEQWQERLEEKREEMRMKREEMRNMEGKLEGELDTEREEVRSEYQETQEMIRGKAKARVDAIKAEEKEEESEVLEAKEIKAKETFKNRVQGNTPLTPSAVGKVQGIIDIRPSGIFEKLGYYLRW